MIRCLFFVEGLNFGGQQLISFNLLKKFDHSKFEVHTAYVFDGELNKLFGEISMSVSKVGDEYDPFNAFESKKPFIKTVWELSQLIRRHKIDVVISNGFFSYFASSLASFVTGRKHVRLVGGDLRKNESFHFQTKWFHLIPLHQMTNFFYGYEFILKVMLEKGIASKKLVDLKASLAVDTDLFKPVNDISSLNHLKSSLGIQPDNLVIGWSGRLEKNMEFRHTLSLCSELMKQGFEDFKLVVIGSGSFEQEFRKRAEEDGFGQKVRWIGHLPQLKLPLYLSIVDIMPLLDKDPHGGSIMRESISCGRTVITVDGPSREQRNIVKDGETGILVSPTNFIEEAADKCIELAGNRNQIKQMGRAARSFAEKQMGYDLPSSILQHGIREICS